MSVTDGLTRILLVIELTLTLAYFPLTQSAASLLSNDEAIYAFYLPTDVNHPPLFNHLNGVAVATEMSESVILDVRDEESTFRIWGLPQKTHYLLLFSMQISHVDSIAETQ